MDSKTRAASEKPFLVLDDNEDITFVLQLIIEDAGSSAMCYQNSQIALDAFCDAPEKYQGIFTDLQMPHMSGEEFIEKIREKDKVLPIVIVTANVRSLAEGFQVRNGVQQVIEKPFDIQDIVKALQRMGAAY